MTNKETASPTPDDTVEAAAEAAWGAWPSANDYPEREAYEAGYIAALASLPKPDDKLVSLLREARAMIAELPAMDALGGQRIRKYDLLHRIDQALKDTNHAD